MESEASNQINNDYTELFFYATMCHVCKRFGDGVQLKRCGDCWMIAYCGPEHQKQHWKQHKPLCKAIRNVLRNYSMDYRDQTTEEWADKKLTFMQLVSSRLGRDLNMSEMDMFLFPNECLICHEWKSLKSCKKCAASFCQIHENHIDHWDICAPLELCLRIKLFFSIEEGYCKFPNSVLHSSSTTIAVHNMRDFIKAFVYIQTDSEMEYNIWAAYSSEYLTRPLTLFYAVGLLNYVLKGTFLIIHIVGANYLEETTLWTWEIFLQLMEPVTSIMIVMIGPELKDKLDPSRTDDNFFLGNKSLFVEYHDVSYEDYVDSSTFTKPDLIVGFHLSIEEHNNKEIWAPSIRVIAKQNCPFILTFSKQRELEKGMNKMNTILGEELDFFGSGKNPFASCKPHRDFGSERVCYHNQYMIIYQSLC
ncbi:uncharacterized protein [Temnothorax longispinosus]|uniref:uncharacterized protein n=1 Tax=Temnothorax longispinosus TaxID=300112 RepID=UPI003A994202